MATTNMVVLFDESGTPAIINNPRTDWFIGVCVVYDQSKEKDIFSRGKAAFGLDNSNPLKNHRIRNSRALSIAQLLVDLPVSIYISALDTTNPAFRKIITSYKSFGDKARREYREVRERPIAQIIHSQMLDHCLFNAIIGHFEEGGGDAAFSIFIDDWAIPKNDVGISLKLRAAELRKNVSSLATHLGEDRPVSVAPLELLNKDNSRKRFIDVVTSVFSRAFLKTTDLRYSRAATDILQDGGRVQCADATQNLINRMQKVMELAPEKE